MAVSVFGRFLFPGQKEAAGKVKESTNKEKQIHQDKYQILMDGSAA